MTLEYLAHLNEGVSVHIHVIVWIGCFGLGTVRQTILNLDRSCCYNSVSLFYFCATELQDELICPEGSVRKSTFLSLYF